MEQDERELGIEHVPAARPGTTGPDEDAPTAQMAPVRRIAWRAPDLDHRPPSESGSTEVAPWPVEFATRSPGGLRRRRASLQIRMLVFVLGVALLGALGGLVALHERPAWFTGLRNTTSTAPSTIVSLPPRISATTTTLAAGSGLLTITSIVPATGAPGQRVTIEGRDLFGPGGYLVATFAGSVVPTSCPTESTCQAVVPPPPSGSDEVAVRLSSHDGDSNALLFRYTVQLSRS